jgi:hypothetical protein
MLIHPGNEGDNLNPPKRYNTMQDNIVKFFVFTIVFILITFLTMTAIYHIASDQTTVLSFGIFSPLILFLLVVILIIYFLSDTLRFYFTLKAIDVNVSFLYMLKLAFINIFVSNITPFATGGGFAQIYFLTKKGVDLADATAASSIRTAIPMIFFTIITPFILIFDQNIEQLFPNKNIVIYTAILLVINLAVIFFVFTLIRKPKRIRKYLICFVRYLRKIKVVKSSKTKMQISHAIKAIDRFSGNITRYFSGKMKYLSLSILFTFIFLIALFSFSIALIKGLNVNASLFSILLSQIVITCFMYYAPTPGATGIAEGSFALLFTHYVQKSEIVSLTFAWRFFTIYIGLIIGAVLFYYEMFKVKRLKVIRPKGNDK